MAKKDTNAIEKINVEEIMQEIRAKIAEKKANNIYPADLDQLSISGKSVNTTSDLDVLIGEMNKYSNIIHNQLAPSNRPIFGPFITFTKRIIRKATAWYFKNITDQINAYNAKNIQTLEAIRIELDYISNAPEIWNNNYGKFEDRFRGPTAQVKNRQKKVTKYFTNQTNILDIGCGRGEFLELMKEQDIQALGIDINSKMVQICENKGLNVQLAEALNHLKNIPDNTLGGIFLGQIVEHLSPSYLCDLLQTCLKKLMPGAYVVIETPNPLSVCTTAINFSRDITHTNILHPDTLRFLQEMIGFHEFDLEFLSPFSNKEILQKLNVSEDSNKHFDNIEVLNTNFERLNSVIFGYQDYILASKKPG